MTKFPEYPTSVLYYDYSVEYYRERNKEVIINLDNIEALKEYNNHVIFTPSVPVWIEDIVTSTYYPGCWRTHSPYWTWKQKKCRIEKGTEVFIPFCDRKEIKTLLNYGEVKLASYQGGIPIGIPNEYDKINFWQMKGIERRESGKEPPPLICYKAES